ncbi:TPA: hypothetical protein DEP06_04260 [Candidatus Daviesbacteria bacterium]|uniref:Uncharacterized protein n=1 Tax=Candidatus Daviesbacteria bacterium GW2011_GWF2_38_6 TaxID=1618432 RepID=A0A0G0KG76_9BACT|nr:MAG: hypothetical protein US99_C0016G0017 [Candidatus Daviesbacteria bacterium GW2011_GWF2_38_6]OGE43960.1 MAG: hypothetical protein A3E67_00725 [Candidatus Daviesbacteria bacterium RIFCSPHIGHO2_12_FULL_38_25]OGE73482.1 MAG: hypothetical protein A3H18_03265 [Candidatus Daviesbacteria bacterium RIFCSPLOWO2_12_FULL_38_10]HCB23002.1 hypothetical protein [Candidatus Daviesbacteria bacterium]
MDPDTKISTGKEQELIMWDRFPKNTQAAFKGVLEDLSITTFDRDPVQTEIHTRKVRDAIRFVSENHREYPSLNNRQVANECIRLASETQDAGLAEELYYLGDIARALIRPGKVNR